MDMIYNIQPKMVSASGSEVNYESQTISLPDTTGTRNFATVATGTTVMELQTTLTDAGMFEFSADDTNCTLYVYNSAGTAVESTFASCEYMLLKSTSQKVYKIANTSTSKTVGITWAFYGDTFADEVI